MLLRIILCLVLLIVGHMLRAQERPEENAIIQPTGSNVSHYVGLQVNQLFRQLLNFGGGTNAINNPYLLTYSVNSKKTGVGFATGIGFSTQQTTSSDNFLNTRTKLNDFAWRVGIEKKKYVSRHWLTTFGWDILMESNKSEVTSISGDIQNPKVTTTKTGYGTGPRIAINYQFHERFMVGTEASMYFKWTRSTSKTSDTPGTSTEDAGLKSFSITVPAVIFGVMKF